MWELIQTSWYLHCNTYFWCSWLPCLLCFSLRCFLCFLFIPVYLGLAKSYIDCCGSGSGSVHWMWCSYFRHDCTTRVLFCITHVRFAFLSLWFFDLAWCFLNSRVFELVCCFLHYWHLVSKIYGALRCQPSGYLGALGIWRPGWESLRTPNWKLSSAPCSLNHFLGPRKRFFVLIMFTTKERKKYFSFLWTYGEIDLLLETCSSKFWNNFGFKKSSFRLG